MFLSVTAPRSGINAKLLRIGWLVELFNFVLLWLVSFLFSVFICGFGGKLVGSHCKILVSNPTLIWRERFWSQLGRLFQTTEKKKN